MSVLLAVAALGAALVAGIFFTFSTFVMRALARLPSHEGIAAMQSINVVVLNPWFFAAFFGTGIVSLAAVAVAALGGDGLPVAITLGSALYLLGCIGVTIAGNVPLNERLAGHVPTGDDAEQVWRHYLSRWTLWNHVRTAASLAAAAVLIAARGAL